MNLELIAWEIITLMLIVCFMLHSIIFESGWWLYLGSYSLGFLMVMGFFEIYKLQHFSNQRKRTKSPKRERADYC